MLCATILLTEVSLWSILGDVLGESIAAYGEFVALKDEMRWKKIFSTSTWTFVLVSTTRFRHPECRGATLHQYLEDQNTFHRQPLTQSLNHPDDAAQIFRLFAQQNALSQHNLPVLSQKLIALQQHPITCPTRPINPPVRTALSCVVDANQAD